VQEDEDEVRLGWLVRQLQSDVISPGRWRLRPELHPYCRHAILFRVKDERVEIDRVLHDAMDFPRHAEVLFRER